MEKIFEQAILYDFYGALLNEHQRMIFEEYVIDNFSLSEIAEEHGISRQGVHDLIKRISRILEGYEEKLHLVSKFMIVKDKINSINEVARTMTGEDSTKSARIITLSEEIIDEL
ncbi:MAG: YlxM family DNA-binding protein [Butyrivibrio sp.]|nr:YlxM family DNA-binding protein [Butyrivibrio sp.]